jgi:hypothetical protein
MRAQATAACKAAAEAGPGGGDECGRAPAASAAAAQQAWRAGPRLRTLRCRAPSAATGAAGPRRRRRVRRRRKAAPVVATAKQGLLRRWVRPGPSGGSRCGGGGSEPWRLLRRCLAPAAAACKATAEGPSGGGAARPLLQQLRGEGCWRGVGYKGVRGM